MAVFEDNVPFETGSAGVQCASSAPETTPAEASQATGMPADLQPFGRSVFRRSAWKGPLCAPTFVELVRTADPTEASMCELQQPRGFLKEKVDVHERFVADVPPPQTAGGVDEESAVQREILEVVKAAPHFERGERGI